MAYMTKVRLYYTGPKNEKKVAAANTVVFDLTEESAEDALARGYIRAATEGEIAEARAAMPAPRKPGKKASKKASKKAAEGDDTTAGGAGDDTVPGGGDDDLA